MLLAFHLGSALLSLVLGSIALFRPTQSKLRASYVLIGTTFASGSYLVYASHSPLLQACMSGITYLAVVSGMTYIARYRLARLSVN